MASQKYKPSEQTPTDEQTQPEPPKSKMINDIHQMLNQLEGNIVLNKRSGYYEVGLLFLQLIITFANHIVCCCIFLDVWRSSN